MDATPAHIFVTAIDTRPLAATPFPIIQVQADDFRHGLAVLSRLAHVYLCRAPGTELPGEELPDVTAEIFEGPTRPVWRVRTSISCIRSMPRARSGPSIIRT